MTIDIHTPDAVCRRMPTYAGVCRRMLTYAVCCCIYTTTDIHTYDYVSSYYYMCPHTAMYVSS